MQKNIAQIRVHKRRPMEGFAVSFTAERQARL